MRSGLLLIGLIASTAQAQPTCNDGSAPTYMEQQGQAAGACVREQARDLIKSGETADLVAIAALANCRAAIGALKSAAATCRGFDFGQLIEERMRSTLREEAIGVVVSHRAGVKRP